MMNTSANTLLLLLRVGLGDKLVGALPSDIDWKEVIDLSFDQGFSGVSGEVADADEVFPLGGDSRYGAEGLWAELELSCTCS